MWSSFQPHACTWKNRCVYMHAQFSAVLSMPDLWDAAGPGLQGRPPEPKAGARCASPDITPLLSPTCQPAALVFGDSPDTLASHTEKSALLMPRVCCIHSSQCFPCPPPLPSIPCPALRKQRQIQENTQEAQHQEYRCSKRRAECVWKPHVLLHFLAEVCQGSENCSLMLIKG